MIPQYQHDVIGSVVMWLDNKISATGQAYINVTGSAQNPQNLLYLAPVSGGRNNIYASPYRSWVWDSCVGGANIPSGFYTSSGQFLTRASGLVLDFVNGQVSTPQNWGQTLSGTYARKEVNVYYSSDEESKYIMEQVYGENRNVQYMMTGLNGRTLVAPLIMVTNARGQNKPFALGGMDDSKNTVRLFVITNSNYLQEGIGSILQDSAHSYIPFAPYSVLPITASGDIKNPPWSYCSGVFSAYGCSDGLWIENVYSYKTNERLNKNTTFFLSAIEMDLSKPRFPRGQ